MKIAMIVRRLDVKGGTQRQALSLANELRRRGHTIKLYAFFYSKEKCYPDLLDGFDVTTLEPTVAADPAFRLLRRTPVLRYLATLLVIRHETRCAKLLARRIDRDVNILNPHDRVAHRVAYFFKRHHESVPSVWNTNDTHSMRWVVEKLADIDLAYRQSWWKMLVYRIRDSYENRRYLAAQDAIVVVDEFNRRAVRTYFGREAVVVRNGPNLDHFTYKKRGPLGTPVRLLTSGIFFPHRRFEDAILAVALLRSRGRDVTLSIIGNPASDLKYATKLESLVRAEHLADHVKFLGSVSEADLIRAYQEHDIYLYPHHLQSDGLSPFEAVASGMAVVVSRSAGAHEILEDGRTALLVNPKDPAGIASAVERMIAEPGLYETLASQAAAFVRWNFSWQRYTDGMLAVYERALSGYRSLK